MPPPDSVLEKATLPPDSVSFHCFPAKLMLFFYFYNNIFLSFALHSIPAVPEALLPFGVDGSLETFLKSPPLSHIRTYKDGLCIAGCPLPQGQCKYTVLCRQRVHFVQK